MRRSTTLAIATALATTLATWGCLHQPSERKLYSWVHHTYTVAVDPGEPTLRADGGDGQVRVAANLHSPARVAPRAGMAPTQIDEAFESNARQLLDCYAQAVHGVAARDSLTVRFGLKESGEVQRVEAIASTAEPGVGECVAARVGTWKVSAAAPENIRFEKRIDFVAEPI
jgi:hypothetical protein